MAALSLALCSSILQNSLPEILIAFVSLYYLLLCIRSVRSSPKGGVVLNLPIVGMLPSLLLNKHHLHDWVTQLLKNNGCTFMIKGPWFTHLNISATCNPANVTHIFSTNFSSFPKGSQFAKNLDILGDGIFNSDSESWRIQRKIAHNLISSKKFRTFTARTSQAKVKDLMHVLGHMAKKGEGAVFAFDLLDVLQRFAFDNTCILVLGTDPASLSVDFPTVPFSKAMDDAMEAIAWRHGRKRNWLEAWKTIDHFINQQVSTRTEELNHKSDTSHEGDEKDYEEERGDLLTSYMNNQLGADELDMLRSDDEFLRDTAMNLMLAGRDTISAALTWFFWLIATNPNVETNILEELRASFPELIDGCQERMKVFDAEKLSQSVYLHAALCESLRLFPPLPINIKNVLKPEVLPTGEIVQGRMTIAILIYALGRMESVWGEDCLEFKPERWISESGRMKFEPSHKLLAFNAGPRICLGKEMAFMQMKAAAAALIYNFRFQVLEGHPVSPKLSVILHMDKGLMVQVTERHHHLKL
ncbi:alkane hydroxylase MAH1-like protein [Cinnamomum micranthum f. kanehirae]|uniref:Alkane hydroxylase MAH1-like protein n=1 Tax=Cinnamomum micranthum f. kanehirae TaxID=337451 RepID=A0A3S3N406_9MAGN|nr:alkane hydroxylase MAH1-like protein [Cinnamomum micranthum f. kanehirae]